MRHPTPLRSRALYATTVNSFWTSLFVKMLSLDLRFYFGMSVNLLRGPMMVADHWSFLEVQYMRDFGIFWSIMGRLT